MVRLFVFLGSLLVLALVAALVVPPFVNWNQFKDRFEVEASRILGQKVEVLGQTSARLLPLPSVTFQNVRVGKSGTGEALLTAKSFHMDMELAPLLKGDFVVVDMSLAQPRLEMRVNKDGALNLTANQRKTGAKFVPQDVSIDNITISDGILRVRDASSNQELIVKDVDVNASARTLAGPWVVRGAVSYLDERFKISGTGGSWQEVGEATSKMSVRFTAKPKSQPYDLDFDGPFSLTNGVPRMEGAFRIKPIGMQSDSERISFARPSRETALKADLRGVVRLTAKGGIVPEYRLDIGDPADPYIINGSAFANFAEDVSFEVQAEGQQINLERLAEQETVGSDNKQTERAGASDARTLKQRLALVRGVLDKVPRFDAEGKIILRLPAVIAGDTVIRDVDLEARPMAKGTGWRINNLAAQLPGRTELRADGTLRLGERFGYEGALVLASQQPSGFAGWLVDDVSPVIRNLGNAGFSANVKISEQRTHLDDLEIVLNNNQLRGLFRRDAGADGKNGLITAKLAGDQVNYDQLAALLEIFVGEKGAAANHDMELAVEAARLRAAGFSMEDVNSRLSLADGQLSIQGLQIGDFAGASIAATGQLSGFPDNPRGRLSGALKSESPVSLLRLFQSRFGPFAFLDRYIADRSLVQKTDLGFDIKAGDVLENGTIDVAIKGTSGGSKIDFTGSTKATANAISLQKRDVKVALTLDNADASKLLSQLGAVVLPLQDAGAGRLTMTANGVPETGLSSDATLSVAGSSARAVGTVKPRFVEGVLQADGDLSVSMKSPDFDPLILLSGIALPGFGQGYSGDALFELRMRDHEFAATEIAANIAGSKWQGALTYVGDARPRPRLTGALRTDSADARSFAALVYSPGPGASIGLPKSERQEESNASAVFAGLDGKIKIEAERVVLADSVEAATAVSGDLALRDGDLGFEDLSAAWLGGQLRGDVALGQTSAARLINGQLMLKNADLPSLTAALGYEAIARGKVDLSGTFESAGKDATNLLSGLTGSGSLVIRNGDFDGLNEDALAKIITASDARGREANVMTEDELAKAGLFDGIFRFGNAEAAMSISSGTMRANNIRLGNEAASIALNMKLALDQFVLDGNARISYNAGREALVGATPGITLNFQAMPGSSSKTFDATALSTFLGMRAADRREREFESQKANILERQRLQRTVRLFNLQAREAERRQEELKRQEEEKLRLQQEQEAERLRLEQEAADKRAESERRSQLQKQADERRLSAKRAAAAAKDAEKELIKPDIIDLLRNRVRDSLSISQ